MPAQETAKLLAAIEDYIQSYQGDESKAGTLDELRSLQGQISGSTETGDSSESPGRREAVQAAAAAHARAADRPKSDRAPSRMTEPGSDNDDDGPGPPMARALKRKKRLQKERQPMSTARGGY